MALNYVAVQWLVCSNAILVVISLSYCLWKHGQHESHRWGNKSSVAMTCVTAVSLHIRMPCFKPKRSPYLFTFVFCVSSCTWSVSFQVSGLPKPKTSSQSQTARVQTLGPARVSGLRKRSLNLGKKFPSVNNENNPGVQATISTLWRNFSFKK